MRNNTISDEVFNLRNSLVSQRDKLNALLEQEVFILEGVTDGEIELDSFNRNSKGEYFNVRQINLNIESLKATINNLNKTISSLSLSASVYK